MFDTWGAFGFGFVGNLNLGGPAPIGARKAALSAKVEPYMQEIALSEQVCPHLVPSDTANLWLPWQQGLFCLNLLHGMVPALMCTLLVGGQGV